MSQPTPPTVPLEAEERQPSQPRRRARFSAQERARRRNHGLFGHLSTLLLQPRLFFYTMPQTRHWLLVALLSLVIVGYIDVQSSTEGGGLPPSAAAPDASSIPPPFDMGSDPLSPPLPLDLGGGDIGDGGSAAPRSTTAQVATAVRAGALVVGVWGLQALLLLLVPLMSGRRPSLGRGFQVAVWASVPLVLMLIVQALYHSAGGVGDSPGISALLTRWEAFETQPADVQWLLMSATSQVTIWRLWALALLYIGAREALQGRRVAALLVCALWAGVAVVAPVMMGMTPLPAPDALRVSEPSAPEAFPLEPLGLEGLPDGADPIPSAPQP